jgi:hypothetical protein
MPAAVTTIASFPTSPVSATEGTSPDGELFMASNGDLLGATVLGGANGIGATYEIVKTGGGFASAPTFLADIPAGLNTLLNVPNLSADANGDLFGLMLTGGANHLGTVVEFPAAGGSPVTLATFTGGAGGSNPGGRLLVDANGNLFGTTASGGVNNAGTVFEIPKTGGGYASTPTTLTSFSAGVTPSGSGNLVEDAAGDLFGTSTNSVFEVLKTGSSYAPPIDLVPAFPPGTQLGSLTIDSAGDIFGTTISDGASDDGSVFEIKKIGSGYASTATTLLSFSAANGADGKLTLNRPKTLIVDANGDIFGTTDPSRQNSGGVVFEIVKTGSSYNPTPVIVANFDGSGDGPLGANLVADANGDLFGTTQAGGVNHTGSAFEITNSGYVVLPALTAGANTSYVAGAASVALDPGLSVTGLTLTGATVSIGTGFVSGDVLTAGSLPAGITSTYNASTGVLTLSGDATPALYQTALDSITFASATALTPSSRTISWSVTDTLGASAQASSSVAVFVSSSDLDIRLQNTSGQLSLWQASGATTPAISAAASFSANPGATWFAVGSGSFFGGGSSDSSDVVLQNTSGAVTVWKMQGATILSGSAVANPGASWQVKGVGEFNGGDASGLVLQNTNGQVNVWAISNGQINPTGTGEVASPGATWHVEATGDFDGDGKSDIVLQNADGQVNIWNMNGNTITNSGAVANPGVTWHVVGAGDFFGGDQSDILLQNDDGSVEIWKMNSSDQVVQGVPVANPGTTWHVASTGDFNQDGTTDIVLQNTSGAVAVWDMDAGQILHASTLANPGATWSVTGNGRNSSI